MHEKQALWPEYSIHYFFFSSTFGNGEGENEFITDRDPASQLITSEVTSKKSLVVQLLMHPLYQHRSTSNNATHGIDSFHAIVSSAIDLLYKLPIWREWTWLWYKTKLKDEDWWDLLAYPVGDTRRKFLVPLVWIDITKRCTKWSH